MYTFDISGVRKNLGGTDYEYATTAAFKDDAGNKQWHPIVGYIATVSMICGFNKITEANTEKVWTRIVEFEYVSGSSSLMLSPEYKPDGYSIKITLDDVRLLIGFRCNADVLTDAQWSKKLLRIVRDNAHWEKKTRHLSAEACDTLYKAYDKFARNVSRATGQEIINRS